MNGKKTIVILGAGFGGLRAALVLAKKIRRSGLEKSCDLILVDRNGYHTYTPTLYEAATASKETANYLELKSIITFPIPEIVNGRGVRFIQAEVNKLDLQNGDIHLSAGENLKFDYLVLALGAETNYFDIPGLQKHSLQLKTFLDAIKIRDTILEAAQAKKDVRILIGGGGSTGVELSGEIQEWFGELAEEFPGCRANVSIVEASPTLLSGFPDRIVKKIQKRLKRFGTEAITNESVAKVRSGKVTLKSGLELPFDLMIWTGGVKAASLMGSMPLKTEKRGRVEVAGEMECLPQSPDLKLYGKIYGLGDAVCFYDPATGRPIPGVARAAISQANIVAYNIWRDLLGRKDHKRYQPMAYPYVIPVGGKWAIAKLGPFIIWGFCGWILKGLVEINYLLSVLPFWRAIRVWLKGLWIFIKNDRLG